MILTGGTSKIIGIEHLVSRVMDLDCRLGSCQWDISEDLNNPEYTTALGLLSYAVANHDGAQSKGGSIINFLRGFLDR